MNRHEHALFPFDTLTPNGPSLHESLYYPKAGFVLVLASQIEYNTECK